jgi:hypothetical protein
VRGAVDCGEETLFLRAAGGWCGMEDLILRHCADGVNAEITTSVPCQNVCQCKGCAIETCQMQEIHLWSFFGIVVNANLGNENRCKRNSCEAELCIRITNITSSYTYYTNILMHVVAKLLLQVSDHLCLQGHLVCIGLFLVTHFPTPTRPAPSSLWPCSCRLRSNIQIIVAKVTERTSALILVF